MNQPEVETTEQQEVKAAIYYNGQNQGPQYQHPLVGPSKV